MAIIENKTVNKWQSGNVIIHHTAWNWTNESYNRQHKVKYYDAYPQNAQQIWRINWNITEFPYIAYHFIIQKDGSYKQNRDITQIWYHCGDYNMNCQSVAYSLNWNFENEEPTTEQLNTLKKLLKEHKEKVGKNLIVKGHRDIKATACPWKNLYSKLNSIMTEVNNNKGMYEEIFYREFWKSSIYLNLDLAIDTLVNAWKIDREAFFFFQIGLEKLSLQKKELLG